ncbi:MAG: translation initiation factor 2 [bacterium]
MVKGKVRNIVVVHSPNPEVFEEAFFLVRESAGVTGRELLDEAQAAAMGYSEEPKKRPLPPLLWFLLGAAAVGAAWIFTVIAR